MKILITGGCGFLGSNLSAKALNRNDELAEFDNLFRLGSHKICSGCGNKAHLGSIMVIFVIGMTLTI